MTDDELIELIEQVKRDGYGTVSLVLNALATRAGVKPEPPAPARDEFDEMAEKMIEFEQRGQNAYWMKICGILIGDCQLVGRCMSDKDRLKPALASALRAVAEKGKAERETMERVKVLAKSYRDGANAHVVAGAIDAIVNSEDRT